MLPRAPQSGVRRNRRSSRVPVEPLESRRLLCTTHWSYLPPAPKWSDAIEQESRQAQTARGGPDAVDIVWTNRGQASDNFGLAFGTSAEAGRQVVDAAIAAWERVITSFNRSDGTNTLQVTISIATDAMGNLVGGFGAAGGPAATAPSDGKPRTGSVTINAGNIVPGTPNDTNGWFFDATPNDYSEFAGTINNPFNGSRSSGAGSDFFSVATLELTHVLGFISPKTGGTGANFNGYRLVSSGMTQATGQRDNSEGGGNFGYYYIFNGPSVSHALTSYNSGDATDLSWGNVIHTAGGSANFNFNAVNYRGTDDDGNALYNGNERLLPSWVTANILKDAYGYTVENPARFGTMMAILNQNTGALTVRGIDNSADTIFITASGGITTVHVDLGTDFPGSGFRPGEGNLSAWVSEFPTGSIQSININAGSGDDVVNLDLPGSIPITVSGGAGGNDLLLIKGSTGYDNINVDFPAITSTALNVQSFSEFEQLRIDTRTGNADLFLPDLLGSMTGVTVQGDSGNETINLHSLEAGKPAVFFLGSGNDTVNVQVDFGVGLVASPVTINGFDGDDTVNIGPVDFAGTIVTQPITFNGDAGNDALVIGSNNADSLAANVSFNGGSNTGGLNDRIIINDQAPSYSLDYDIQTTLVRRTGLSTRDFNYSQAEEIIINAGQSADAVLVRNGVSPIVRAFGNGGNDTFTRGDGFLSASSGAQFDGGPGIDQITFDDRNNPGNIIFDCRPNEVIYGGLIIQQTTGFESVGVLAGTGNNEITFAGTISQNFAVDAGPGSDTIIVGFSGSGPGAVTFAGSAVVNGGEGNDTFTINSGQTTIGNVGVAFSGGTGTDVLNVVNPLAINYDIYTDRVILRPTVTFGLVMIFDYQNFDNLGFIGGNGTGENFFVYSTSIFTSYGVLAGGGNDSATILTDPFGINSFFFNGGSGTDSFTIDQSSLSATTTYNFTDSAGLGTIQTLSGIVSSSYSYSFTESLLVQAGGAGDTFNFDRFGLGSGVTLRGGGGDDVINVGNGNYQANLTNAASFSVDGQGGNDTMNMNNAGTTSAWSYRMFGTSIVADTPPWSPITPPSYSWTTGISNLETIDVNAGVGDDVFRISTVPTGLAMNLIAGAGVDALLLGDVNQNLGLVAGPIFFDTGPNFGRVSATDTATTFGKTAHMDAGSLGAYPGDNLFAAGGSLRFTTLVNQSFFSAFRLSLGGSADTIYAQPLATGNVSIEGNNPTTSPGDTLNLALAAAENYVVNAGVNGSVTSSNLQTLSWFGIESPIGVDDAAPVVVANDFDFNPGAPRGVSPMQFTATFSEDVSPLLNQSFLELFNATTGVFVPTADIAVAWDPGSLTATFTFPNYAGGLLPDGVYQARILAGLVDPFGNAGGDGPYYTFVWSQGTSGDDAFRVALDSTTSDHQVFLNNDTTPAFLAGPGTAKIVLFGGAGDDIMTVDLRGGDPVTPEGLFLIGGTESDTLRLLGSTAADDVAFDAGAVTHNGSTTSHSAFESFSVDGLTEFDTLSINDGRVGVGATQRLASLAIADGAGLDLPSFGGATLVVRDLSLAPTARLDLAGAAMVLDYTGASPVSTIRELLITGRNGGAWDGFGIASSSAAVDPSTAIGYAEASDLYGTFPAVFGDEPVDATSVLLRFTLVGDADLSGGVNIADFSRLAANFNQPGGGWSRGDFNYDGSTGIADFAALAGNFNRSLPAGVAGRVGLFSERRVEPRLAG